MIYHMDIMTFIVFIQCVVHHLTESGIVELPIEFHKKNPIVEMVSKFSKRSIGLFTQ